MPRLRYRFVLSLLFVLAVAPALFAVIKAELQLQKVIVTSQHVVLARVEKLYADKPAMVLQIVEDLKGKLVYRKLPVVLKGDQEAEKLKHVPQLLKRLADDLPLIVFIDVDPKNDKKMTALAYTNGTWMQWIGDKTGADTAVWSLTHGEPYLRRTYRGTTEELKALLTDVLAGKKRAPKYDEKEPPGFGPEVKGGN